MPPEQIVQRLRLALLTLAAFALVFTALELWLTGHTEDLVQLIPFGLAGLGLAAIVTVLVKPSKLTFRLLRLVMMLVILGSLFGMVEHLEGNFAFELEIRPNAGAREVVREALKGANPPLAPGILAFAGVIAVLATYAHPALVAVPRASSALDSDINA